MHCLEVVRCARIEAKPISGDMKAENSRRALILYRLVIELLCNQSFQKFPDLYLRSDYSILSVSPAVSSSIAGPEMGTIQCFLEILTISPEARTEGC